MKYYNTLVICGTLILFISCSNGNNEQQNSTTNLDTIQEFDTNFYLLSSYVVNGREVPKSDSDFYYFGDRTIIHFGTENTFKIVFYDDSLYISGSKQAAVMWIQFSDTLTVAYASEKSRTKNNWQYQSNGEIQISMANPKSELSLDSQYIMNRNLNYAVLEQIRTPLKKADHIKNISNSIGDFGHFKESQNKHEDFDPKTWK